MLSRPTSKVRRPSRQSSAGEHLHRDAALKPDPPGVKPRRAAGTTARPRNPTGRSRSRIHPSLPGRSRASGEQNVEPCEVHLLLVNLDLCEVGVHGDVQRQVLGDCTRMTSTPASASQSFSTGGVTADRCGCGSHKRLHFEVQARRGASFRPDRNIETRNTAFGPDPATWISTRREIAPLIAAGWAADLNAPDLLDTRAIAERFRESPSQPSTHRRTDLWPHPRSGSSRSWGSPHW